MYSEKGVVLPAEPFRIRCTGSAMGYRTIFSVVNEHTGSTVAARYAMALAVAGKSRLVLYSAHGEGVDETTFRHIERHLDHLAAIAFDLDIPVTRITESGNIVHLLPHRVQEEHADLVFYPLTPSERYKTTFQQQTVHHLLRVITVDLAIMRIMHMGKPHPRHILVPLGGVINQRERLTEFLAALAKCFNAQLTLFHRPAGGGMRDTPEDFARVRNGLRQHHLPVLERSGTGHIPKAIALEAISHHHDLIVLGASERGALRRLFFGNPAGDVLQQPPCNAILFRAAPARP